MTSLVSVYHFEAIMLFRYPGGKNRSHVQQQILHLLPEGMQEYREPLVGGGGIFWGIQTDVKRWINDKDENLTKVYRAFQDRPEEFINLCRTIFPYSAADPHARKGNQKISLRLQAKFHELLADTNADAALRYWFLSRHSRLGRVLFDTPSRMTFEYNRGWDVAWDGETITQAVETLRGVKITTGDYLPLLTEPGENVCLYIDPPYVRANPTSIANRLYAFEFDLSDHERLAERVHECSHKIIVSYNDCDMVRNLYRGWEVLPCEWAYVGQGGTNKKRGQELIIANFDVASKKTQRSEITQRMSELGKRKSAVKAGAARENGKRGGRPKGTPQSEAARAKISAARQANSSAKARTEEFSILPSG